MKVNAWGLLFGAGCGFVLAWAHLTDPVAIRNMLLLRELDVFWLMGSAVVVAGIGARVLRAVKASALATGEAIEWKLERAERRHVFGSLIFGAGWSLAGTCPGPVASMIGQGHLAGLLVASGLVGGVLLQRSVARKLTQTSLPADMPGTAGL